MVGSADVGGQGHRDTRDPATLVAGLPHLTGTTKNLGLANCGPHSRLLSSDAGEAMACLQSQAGICPAPSSEFCNYSYGGLSPDACQNVACNSRLVANLCVWERIGRSGADYRWGLAYVT